MRKIILSLILLLSATAFANTPEFFMIRGDQGLGTVTPIRYHGKLYYITADHVCGLSGTLFVEIDQTIYFYTIVKRDPLKHLCLVTTDIHKTLDVSGAELNLSNNPGYVTAYGYGQGHVTVVPLRYLASQMLQLGNTIKFFASMYLGVLVAGMSGGPTLSDDGRVVGINTAAADSLSISMLVPASQVKKFLDDLK